MADKAKRAKATSSGDVVLTSTLQTLKKWLKSLKVDSELNISGQDIPTGLQHGILFLDYLRTRNFPEALTASENCLLKIMADLHVKTDPDSDTSHGQKSKTNVQKGNDSKGKTRGENLKEDDQVQKHGPKTAGPKKGAKKLAPLREAMNKLNIQENKGCGCKGDCKSKICGCRKRDVQCNASCKCSEGCVNKKVTEPKANANNEKTMDEKSDEPEVEPENNDSDSESSSKSGSDTNLSSEDEDLEKEYIDWNKHISTLVECPKCKRSFFAARVGYHMQVCKQI